MGERLKDRVALVVGAGSAGPGWGNGKAAAVLFAREGARVFCVDINPAAAEETAGLIAEEGGEAAAHRADVSKAGEVAALVARCLELYGRIDVLDNNVGIVEVGGPVEASEESWDRVMAVNLKSMFLTCKHVLPAMERQGGGAIVNIGSVAGIRWLGVPYISYHASKGAVVSFTRAVALEYAAKGIRANAILPGLMNTPMIVEPLKDAYAGGDVEKMLEVRAAQCPMGRMGDAWDVAHAALFLASDEARYITGTELVVDGGITAKVS
ncbi:MAG: SDR family oxidoreductase [Rhodospirillales bacterium]|nr:SDR family oxidoreductase [Rhodospirillales bacterium]MDH3913422.1 SDR family oxidoreductase [Rhodospirillales bacterium]MDH3969478.1 SDR family oxidoreductase [Rhodospirillales bacterium]